MLESQEFLDVHEIFESVIIDFQTFNGKFPLEGVGVELTYFVVVDVQLLQLLQILKTVDLYYLVS
jgi:hypothetical protein